MRPHRALTILVLGATLGMAACGGGGGKSSSQQQPQGDVEQQLGFDQASLDARLSRAESRVRDCLKGQGFEYVPIDPVAQRAAVFGTGNVREQERQFGYFVTTLWGRGRPQADPNQRIRASLAAADRAAYDRTLGGDNPGATLDAFDTGDFTKLGGCRRKAIEAVFGGAQVITEIQGKLDQLDERVVQDQRMVRATEKWSSCMAGAGYHYTDPDAIDVDFEKRLEKIVGPVPGKFQTGPPPGTRPRPYDHTALGALQREELSTWRVDMACERTFITPVESKVRAQYERVFRQRNQALLREVKPVR